MMRQACPQFVNVTLLFLHPRLERERDRIGAPRPITFEHLCRIAREFGQEPMRTHGGIEGLWYRSRRSAKAR